jgi:predicted aspartyl protease
MKARFPFTKIGKMKLGTVYRPYAEVEIGSDEVGGWIPIKAVVDTGADYTLLPRRYAFLLGIDLATDCVPETTLGVGGSETIHLYKKGIKIRLEGWEGKVPLGFLERDDVPALLGRLKCLEIFELIFKNRATVFEKN